MWRGAETNGAISRAMSLQGQGQYLGKCPCTNGVLGNAYQPSWGSSPPDVYKIPCKGVQLSSGLGYERERDTHKHTHTNTNTHKHTVKSAARHGTEGGAEQAERSAGRASNPGIVLSTSIQAIRSTVTFTDFLILHC